MPASVPGPAQMIDRESELGLVAKALDEAPGHGSLLVFEGAAGMGKSRLLAELGRAAREIGVPTLRARGGELEVGFRFGVARQLLEPRVSAAGPLERAELLATAGAAAPLLAGSPTQVNGNGGAGDPADAALNGMWRLVRRLVGERIGLITVDDLQWVDRPSLELSSTSPSASRISPS